MIVCGSCGQESPDGFKFCPNCAAALVVAAPAREVRKVVTIVFCDLTGSTELGDRTDPEALRATMRGYYEEMRAILERHGGTVEKFVGDAVMAVFGVPASHEDDALRAVRAAWEMREAVPRLGLQARIGVNTGEVVAGEGDTLVTGDAVNVAARLEQAAEAGEVLIGAETRRLVRGAVEVEPVDVTAKGKPEAVPAFRLVAFDPDAAAFARHLDAPLVGRRGELDQLQRAFDRAVREQRCHLFTLLGSAGVGKSRLVSEFLSSVDAAVLEGRCLDYGEGITYWPVISILKQLGERGDEALERVVEGASTANELFWSVRALLEEVASDRPLIVLFDDIHWAESTFLDLIDHVADLSRGAPILVLCVARPELLDKRPGWAGGKLNATTVLLEPLDTDECAQLIAAHGGVDETTRDRILAAADGNPLFVEEMVAFAREDGDVRIPATVHALLQARLDQLGGEERSVIERGAIEGQVFHRGAVLELTRSADVELQLVGLVRKELIRPARTTFTGDHAFQFRHLLIRDAAYDALPKETRADLHERFAAWLERHGQDLIELDEVLGYHLEQAARYRRELGRPEPELERRAGLRLEAAGRRAGERSDGPGALNLLGRAIRLLSEDDPKHLVAFLDRLALLMYADDQEERRRMIEQLEASDETTHRLHGAIARLQLRIFNDPENAIDDVLLFADDALEVFEAAGDERGLADLWELRASANWLQSRAEPTLAATAQSAQHAARADMLAFPARHSTLLLGPLIHGPFTPDEIRTHLAAFPKESQQALILEAHLARIDGRFEDALEIERRVLAIIDELGLPLLRVPSLLFRAQVLTEMGRLDDSLETWGEVRAALTAFGQTSYLSTALINMGFTHYRRGDADEAWRLAVEGEELGAAEDIVNFAWGDALRAMIAADRGDHDAALELARNANEQAARIDFPDVQAEAHQASAHVLRRAGRTDEARTALDRALSLWETYGWTQKAAHARELLLELTP